MKLLLAVVTALCLCIGPVSGVRAQSNGFVLAVDPALDEAGIAAFLVPRFALKHGIRPTLQDRAEGADAAILPVRMAGEAAAAAPGAVHLPAFYLAAGDPAPAWSIVVFPGRPETENAAAFADWLTGEVGQRTVATFAPAAGPAFLPGALPVEAPPPPPVEGDREAGEKLAHFHCGRCHVVSERNRMGGIGSTPSFAAMRANPEWQSKFLAFWSANPHPSFTQVEGLTDPFDPAKPPHIAPVEITLEEVEAIAAYAGSIPPKDLGAVVESR